MRICEMFHPEQELDPAKFMELAAEAYQLAFNALEASNSCIGLILCKELTQTQTPILIQLFLQLLLGGDVHVHSARHIHVHSARHIHPIRVVV